MRHPLLLKHLKNEIHSLNSVQTRRTVKGEARKGPLSGDFLGDVDLLRSACSLGIPLENL